MNIELSDLEVRIIRHALVTLDKQMEFRASSAETDDAGEAEIANDRMLIDGILSRFPILKQQ